MKTKYIYYALCFPAIISIHSHMSNSVCYIPVLHYNPKKYHYQSNALYLYLVSEAHIWMCVSFCLIDFSLYESSLRIILQYLKFSQFCIIFFLPFEDDLPSSHLNYIMWLIDIYLAHGYEDILKAGVLYCSTYHIPSSVWILPGFYQIIMKWIENNIH